MSEPVKNSRIPGFYNLTRPERLAVLAEQAGLVPDDLAAFGPELGLSADQADHMIENVVGLHALPVGIALNFLVNGRDVLVPMAIEEPSVVAGASFMAGWLALGAVSSANHPARDDRADAGAGCARFACCAPGDSGAGRPAIGRSRWNRPGAEAPGRRAARPGSADNRAIAGRAISGGAPDLRRARCNGRQRRQYRRRTAGPAGGGLTGGRVHLRILSNLADRRLARARCTIPLDQLGVWRVFCLKTCAMASLPPGHLPPLTPTGLPLITRAS